MYTEMGTNKKLSILIYTKGDPFSLPSLPFRMYLLKKDERAAQPIVSAGLLQFTQLNNSTQLNSITQLSDSIQLSASTPGLMFGEVVGYVYMPTASALFLFCF